jgi:O-antigen/teichoic acid export membrane protein
LSATRRIAFAVGAAWVARGVSIVSGLALLPVFLRWMDREEYGVWLVLGNNQAFLALLGFGVAPVLTRDIALAKGTSGADPDMPLTAETRQRIADLVVTGRVVLRGLAGLAFLIAATAGVVTLAIIPPKNVPVERALLAWTLICAGHAVGVAASYLDCWMAGIGYVGWSTVIVAGIALLTTVANIAAVGCGGGLVSLACILLASWLVQRGVFRWTLRRYAPDLVCGEGRWNGVYARDLVRPALTAWLTSLGAFLILQTDSYFIARFQGWDVLPPYSGAYQIVNNLYLLAVAFATSSTAFLSQAWQAGEHDRVRAVTIRSAQIGLAIMAAGAGFTLTAGREFMELLHPNAFVGYGVLIVFCTMLTLEAQHVILSLCARSTDDERYALVALIAGILNLVLTWVLIGPLGLLGVALGTTLAQVFTNNWYAVYRPLVRLRLDLRLYVRRVVLLWAATFGGSLLIGQLLAGQVRTWGRLSTVFAAAVGSGLVLAAALWRGVLELPQRRRLVVLARDWLRLPGGPRW